MTHRHITPMQAERLEQDRRHLLRKITSAADDRMRSRTAKEQLAEALKAGQAPDDLPEPDHCEDVLHMVGVMR